MPGAVEFRLFGGVEARIGDRPVDLGSVRQRCVLVALLVDANHVVPVDQLVTRAWGQASASRGTLYSYLSRLRNLFTAAGNVKIVRGSGGYVLTVDPLAVDLHRFRHLVTLARVSEDAEHAAARYEQGLNLWRGEAFAGLDTPWLNELRASVDAELHATRLSRNELMLRLGRHMDVLADLTASAAQQPLDEHLVCQLMLALYRAGRRAEALWVYQRTCSALAEELGLDPGPELSDLYRRVLVDDVGVTPARTAGRVAEPRQFPNDFAQFTGRDRDLAQLHARLDAAQQGGAPAAVTAIDGPPGVGKTSLAVHFGHQVAGRFPDGQLYLDLRGYGPQPPMTPMDAVTALLRSFGIPPDLTPATLDSRAALLRTILAGKRMLILLDNARDAGQVRPLLPGPGSLVLVTSRNQLRSLAVCEGAQRITLEPLDVDESKELLSRSVSIGDEAKTRLARLCEGLPLALAVAAERVARDPAVLATELSGRLPDGYSALDVLDTGDDRETSLRSVFSWSYQALPDDAARMFRLLGIVSEPDISVPAAAALAGIPTPMARHLLEQLVRANQLRHRRPGRYELHALLRIYAAELARACDPPEARSACLGRLSAWYTRSFFTAGPQVTMPAGRVPAPC